MWKFKPTTLWVIGLVVAVIATYATSLQIPLLFDDLATLSDNTTIRDLNKLGTIFAYPEGIVLAWRPFANFSYALSFAMSGTNPIAHHVLGLLIHSLTAVILFFVLRQTLKSGRLKDYSKDATSLAGVISLLWAVHPVLTNTVVYISQRTESLMALFYLLTLYFFIKAAVFNKPLWYILCFCSCLLGTLSKEVIVTAPLLVLLYDRTFISGSFKEALKKHKYIFLLLSSTWIAIGVLTRSLKTQAVGYTTNINVYEYALTETKAIYTYVRLSLYPNPLIFDRGPVFVHSFSEAFGYIVILLSLLLLTSWALVKKPAAGFLGASFFIILAPTSSIIPIAEEPIAENRLYLPLVAIICLVTLTFWKLLGIRKTVILCSTISAVFYILSIQRIQEYSTGFKIWSDTIAKAPDNPRAHNNLGLMWEREKNKPEEALKEYTEALRLDPNSAEPRNNRAILISQIPGRENEAVNDYTLILKKYPNYAEVHNNLALILSHQPGREKEALFHYERALALKSLRPDLYTNYAGLLRRIPGREKDALKACVMALQVEPNNITSLNNMAVLLADNGQLTQAELLYKRVLDLKPESGATYFNLGNLISSMATRKEEAIFCFSQAARYSPTNAEAEYNLANLLASTPDNKLQAITHFEAALRINPNHVGAHNNLALILATKPERIKDAIKHYKETIRLMPNGFGPHYNLGTLLMNISGQESEAIIELNEALKLNPDFKPTKDALNLIYSRRKK